MKNKRPPGLVVIVVYKTFVAFLIGVTATVLLLALNNYQSFVGFSKSYILEGKLEIIELLLEKMISVKRQTLQFSGIAAGIYAIITLVEALGLWYEKGWARILVLVLVGISIPAEIFELIKGITVLKFVVFLGNLAIFWYLLRHFPKHSS